MLGKREAQRGLLEADTMYGDFVGRKTFYGFLAAQRDELFRDEAFAGLYNAKLGRPSVAPSVLATALVLQSYDRVSDDEARRRAAFDLQWKVALGIPVDSVPFAKSTLQEFRAQLIVHQEQGAIFQASLELAKRRGHFKAYAVDAGLMKAAPDHALFMHCLPAHRGDEVSDAVMDGPQSVVFPQAENRLHGQKAILLAVMGAESAVP